jgi:hypothetical protein
MKPLLLSWWVLCGADAATTHHIVTTGGREVILPTQNPYAIDGVLLTQAFAADHALRNVARTHPRLAIGLGVGLVAVRGFAVAHNLRQIQTHSGAR